MNRQPWILYLLLLVLLLSVSGCFLSSNVFLNISIDGQGTVKITPDDKNKGYKKDTVIQLEALPKEGWAFLKWEGDLSGENLKTSIKMDKTKYVKAVFKSIPTKVAILDSELTNDFYTQLGWPYEAMMDGIFDVFNEAKIEFDIVSDADLANSNKLSNYKLLVLPGNRKMDTSAADVVLNLAASGKLKVFGTYQSSFRDAANQRVGDGNFQLEEIYDMKYSSWIGTGGVFIGKPEDLNNHSVWKDLPEEIKLVTADQLICQWLGNGKPIGIWLNNSLNPMREEGLNVALVETEAAIYCNAWFWHPDNTTNDDFRHLAVNIIQYLLNK